MAWELCESKGWLGAGAKPGPAEQERSHLAQYSKQDRPPMVRPYEWLSCPDRWLGVTRAEHSWERIARRRRVKAWLTIP